jgi:signal transduction histidine kinase
VGIRPKIFLIFFAFGLVPMLLLTYVNYLSGVEAAEALLRGSVERETIEIARDVEERRREQEAGLAALARTKALRDYVQGSSAPPGEAPQASLSLITPASDNAADPVPDGVSETLKIFLLKNRYYSAITCLSSERRTLLRVEPKGSADDPDALHYQTRDFISPVGVDERVWTTPDPKPLRRPLAHEPKGMILRYSVPMFTGEEGVSAPRGALVADLRADVLFGRAAGDFGELYGGAAPAAVPHTSSGTLPPRIIVALDAKGDIIYHTNKAIHYQPIGSAMPTFKPVADRMAAGESGWMFYDSTGGRWLANYMRVAPLDSSLAVAGNYSLATEGLRRRGWISLLLSILAGVVTACALTLVVGRTARQIERVTEGAVAIAGGRLDQRIEVRSNDETRLLAESFNKMSDRLREQMAREAETRQFQAFMRLSAMMTHDLKNAIAALSLIVRNMERRFHREEFRADAMQSLTIATDKLRALVAKLSGPVESLSGEYRRPRPADLIPIIERVLSLTATPAASLHQVETRLPPSLVAPVDAERIERVVENLVINALEAMGAQSGRLTVEAGRADEGHVFFSVADTGPGMTEEFKRDRLFRAFATTKNKGVGLGLYTCREVVRAHNGRIEVESRQGSGTCFRVVLPSPPDHEA